MSGSIFWHSNSQTISCYALITLAKENCLMLCVEPFHNPVGPNVIMQALLVFGVSRIRARWWHVWTELIEFFFFHGVVHQFGYPSDLHTKCKTHLSHVTWPFDTLWPKVMMSVRVTWLGKFMHKQIVNSSFSQWWLSTIFAVYRSD